MTLAASVLERLRRQQARYRDMVALVRTQSAGWESLDVDGFLGLIEQKRKLLSEIDALEAELAPVKGDWHRVRAGFSPEESRELEATLEGTKSILQELVGLEDLGRAVLEERRLGASAAPEGLLGKRRARGAYGGGNGRIQ